MKNRKLSIIASLALAVLGAVFISACSSQPAEVQITVNCDKKISVLSQGIGASIHVIEDSITFTPDRSYGGSAWGGNPRLDDAASWEKVFWHAQWLGLDWTRLELEQRIYNPERDKYTWDSYEMQLAYRYLDWCEANGVDVLLQQMWSNVEWMAYPQQRNSSIGILRSAPYDKELFAESFATLVDYLVNTKGYTCIKWLNFINEPGEDWSWWQTAEDLDKAEILDPVFAIVRSALDRKNLSVPLLGPTYNLQRNTAEFTFKGQLGGYDVHSYWAKFDWYQSEHTPMWKTLEEFDNYGRLARADGKPFLISEYGTMAYGFSPGATAAMSSRDAVLTDAELLIRSMNIGVNGFNKWSFINRGDLDGQWQLIDTWDIANRTLLPADSIRPHENSYNAFALLSRFVPRNSDVLEATVEGGNDGEYDRVFAAALRTPSGNYTIVMVNDSDNPYTVSVDFTKPPRKTFYCYRFDNLMPQKAGKVITLQPKDIVTLSTYRLGANDMGKIVE